MAFSVVGPYSGAAPGAVDGTTVAQATMTEAVLGNYDETVVALATSGTVTIDLSLGNVFTCAVAGPITFAAPINMGQGDSFTLIIVMDATPSAITWNSVFKHTSDTAPTMVASATHRIGCVTVDTGTAWETLSAGSRT